MRIKMNKKFEIKCELCNHISSSNDKAYKCFVYFGHHIKKKHKITKDEYFKKYAIPDGFNFKSPKITSGKFTLKCSLCDTTIYSDIKRKCISNLINHNKHNHKLPIKEYFSNCTIPEDYMDEYRTHMRSYSSKKLRDPIYVKKKNEILLKKIGQEEYNKLPCCKLCEFKGKQLYKHVSNIHNIQVSEYRKKYEGLLETPEYLEHLSESRTGENNPMYNNGSSECSPFAPEFYIKKGFSKKKSIKLAKEKTKQVKADLTEEQYSTKIEFYKNKYGIDDIEAQDMLYKRQQTNSVSNIAKRNDMPIKEAQKLGMILLINGWQP